MTKILRSTDSNNAGSSTITQAQFQAQAQAQVDGLRQLVGNADITAGATLTSSLNSPITLYVDPNIGADDWEGGSYNTNAASRIENQQLATGYSPNRPFRTLNRAVIEAAILTSKTYLSAVGDLVTIFCAPGQHTLLNGAGDANTDNITSWGTSKSDTKDSAWNTLLTRFNDPNWGIILPRGVTICGWDLRKTVIRPAVVPAASGFSRRRMLRVTSDCYFFGFSFKDALGVTTSHHNLACFGFAGQAALDLFYQKIRAAFPDATTSSNLDAAKAITLNKEYEIVGPQPDSPSIDSDTTNGSSPYIFNCSLRSQYGLCGIDIDGSVVTGIKSLVTAQFTNVSLQKDIAAYQKYDGSNWVDLVDYNDYINTDINNLRFKVTDSADYRHFALKATNNAFMQAVSIFAIGNAVHHWCESGGEITLTNSNSNFGGVASLSLGFRGQGKSGGAFPQDTNFTASYIRRAKAIPTDGSNIRRIFLGTVSSITSTQITLTTALDYAGLLTKNQYSLKASDYIWIENNNNDILSGVDFKAQLASSPWSSNSPTQITVQNNGNSNFNETGVAGAAVGNRVYIRRLVDNRAPEERETSFIVQNTGTCRRPQGSYVIRMDVNGNLTSAATSTQLDPANGGGEVFLVGDSGSVTTTKAGTTLNATSFKVVAVSGDSQRTFSSSSDNFYRTAEVVVYQNRYYRSLTNQTATSWDATQWRQTLRDIPVSASAGGIESARSNVAPQIILDGDTDSSETSTTLGWDLSASGSTVYTNQLRSGADYRALRNLMLRLGYAAGTGAAQVDGILHPVAETSRDYDIVTGAVPSGGKLASRAAWPLEFNRPSIIRAFGLAYEWVGYGNYSKSLPKYQVFRLNDQQGLDVLAANIGGGRCFNQGTTEEGLIVTPFTIQDLGTGRGFSTDTAGLGGISGDVEFPTTFPNLTVTNTLSAQTYVGLPTANTTRAGIVELATDAEATAAAATSVALTPGGLGKWAAAKKLVFRSTSTQRIFIGTWDAISPVSFDNTYRSNYWPAQNTDFSNKPDGTTFKPFATLRDAALWCNEYLGPDQTAELIMQPGFYNLRSAEFNCKIAINGSSIGTTSSFTSGNIGDYSISTPGNSVFFYRPWYLRPYANYNNDNQVLLSLDYSSSFISCLGGTIARVHFLSTDAALGATQIPDSEFSGSSLWRTSTVKSSAGTRLTEYIKAMIADVRTPSSPNYISGYSATPLLTGPSNKGASIVCTAGSLIVQECTFGALFGGACIRAENCSVKLAGIRIRGNEYIDLTGYSSNNYKDASAFNSFLDVSGSCVLQLGGAPDNFTGTIQGGDLSYNLPINNIYLQKRFYGSDSRNGGSDPADAIAGDTTSPFNDTAGNRELRGPMITYFVNIYATSRLIFPEYRLFNTYAVSTAARQSGFVGKFGNLFSSSKARFANLAVGASVAWNSQYFNSASIQAGVASPPTATTALAKGDTSIVANNIATDSGLNLQTVRYTKGIYYELGITISSEPTSTTTVYL